MRYTVSALALASLLSLPASVPFAHAQQDSTQQPPADNGAGMQNMHRMRGPMTTEDQLAHLTRALNLTSDQQTQIKPLLDERRQQMMTIHQDTSMSRDDKMAKMRTLDDDTHAKIAAILNPDQKTKYEQMGERRQQNMQKMQNMNGGMQPQK